MAGFFALAVLLGLCTLTACSARATPARTPFYLPTRAEDGQTQVFNLFVARAGAYQLTRADLLAAGLRLAADDARQLRITWRGQPVPVMVNGQGEDFTLRFYGSPSDSRFSAQNIYQLQVGEAALPMQVSSPAAGASGTAVYSDTIRSEENLVYAPQAAEMEGWFWQVLPAPSTNRFEIELARPAEGPARLRLGVWSQTRAEVSPDHHLQATLNGQAVLDATWDGEGFRVLAADLPAGALVSGTNVVEITVPGDTGAPAERSYLDWIEVSYFRQAKAVNDLAAVVGTSQPIRLEGFEGPVTLWQIDSLTQTVQLQMEEATDGQVTIPAGEGKRYLAVGPHGFLTPGIQAAASVPDLRSLPAADYLAIGPGDLLDALQPLLEYHTHDGLRTAAIPLQAIYDQFNAGFPEPEAIRRFLAFAAENWDAPSWGETPGGETPQGETTQYVLLLGDFTFDPRGYTAPAEANRLPTFFTHTYFGGETASDVPFAQLDGDNRPDIALGRLPARSTAQVEAYVHKALAYMQQTDLAWRWRLLAVADGQEASFANDARAFLDRFDRESFTETLFTPAAGTTDANSQIDAYLEEGYGLVGYFGHGSVNMWGKDRLFTTDDVSALDNLGRLPVVINMNCLTGLFTHPQTTSLAESLLWQPEGGAVAVLAPTGLTLPSDQALLSSALVTAIDEHPGQRLGASFLAAQRQMPQDWSGANEVLATFLYFGDPALRPWK